MCDTYYSALQPQVEQTGCMETIRCILWLSGSLRSSEGRDCLPNSSSSVGLGPTLAGVSVSVSRTAVGGQATVLKAFRSTSFGSGSVGFYEPPKAMPDDGIKGRAHRSEAEGTFPGC